MVHEACTSKTRITHMFYIALYFLVSNFFGGDGGETVDRFYFILFRQYFADLETPALVGTSKKKIVSYDNLFRAILQLYRKGCMKSELFSNPKSNCFCLGFCNLLQVRTLINAKKQTNKQKSSVIMLLHSVAFAVKGCYYLSIFQT